MNTETGEIKFFEDGDVPAGFIPITTVEAGRLSRREAKDRAADLKQMRATARKLCKREIGRRLNQREVKAAHDAVMELV